MIVLLIYLEHSLTIDCLKTSEYDFKKIYSPDSLPHLVPCALLLFCCRLTDPFLGPGAVFFSYKDLGTCSFLCLECSSLLISVIPTLSLNICSRLIYLHISFSLTLKTFIKIVNTPVNPSPPTFNK